MNSIAVIPVPPEHARLSPSASPRWMNCAGSVALIAQYGEEGSNAYADEGNAMHELAAEALRSKLVGYRGKWNTHVGRVMSNGVTLTDDHVVQSARYAEYVMPTPAALAAGVEMHVEVLLRLGFIDPGMFGTADAVLIDWKAKRMTVVDLKTGRNRVHVRDNPQLELYALGALRQFDPLDEITHVTLTIVQPRLYDENDAEPAESVEYLASDLRKRRAVYVEAAEATHAENAPLTVGHWCRFCPARNSCPKQQALSLSDVQEILTRMAQPLVLDELSNGELSNVFRVVKACEAWSDAVKREIRLRMDSGQNVQGCSYGTPRRMRDWVATEADTWIRKLPPLVGQLLLRPVTVAQAEKALQGSGVTIPSELVIEKLTAAPLYFDANAPEADPRDAFGVLPNVVVAAPENGNDLL